MRDLNWREFAIDSLAAPFDHWRLLIACAATSLAVFALSAGSLLSWVYLDSESSEYFLFRVRYLSAAPYIFLGAIVFQWCWMTALLHGTRRHLISFMIHKNFWQCCVPGIVIGLWFILVLIVTRLSPAVLQPIVRMLPQPIMMTGYQVLVILSSFLTLWIGAQVALRLMLWPTFMIAGKRWYGPLSVRRMARPYRHIFWKASFSLSILVAVSQIAVWVIYRLIYGNGLIVNGTPTQSILDINPGTLALGIFAMELVIGTILFAAICSGLTKIYRSATMSLVGEPPKAAQV